MKETLEYFEKVLDSVMLPIEGRSALLKEAMRYAVGTGGKRIRPLVCLFSAQAVGGKMEDAVYPAAAIELLHNYTLVHDDLPAMDNDRERRGKPTVWAKYGQANAILVGDALLALAYRTAARAPRNVAQIIDELGEKGVGVVEGQVADLCLEGASCEGKADLAEFVYEHKTADLFIAAAKMGALAAGAASEEVVILGEFARNLGLAFQYQDDLLDGDGAYSKDETQTLASEATEKAINALKRLKGDTSFLEKLTTSLLGRKN